MIPRENSEQQWFECSACGAAMDGDEIDSVQPATAARRQFGHAAIGPLTPASIFFGAHVFENAENRAPQLSCLFAPAK